MHTVTLWRLRVWKPCRNWPNFLLSRLMSLFLIHSTISFYSISVSYFFTSSSSSSSFTSLLYPFFPFLDYGMYRLKSMSRGTNNKRSSCELNCNSIKNSLWSAHFKLGYFPWVALCLASLLLYPGFTGSKPAEDEGFLRAIKIRSTTSFGGEVKPSVSCRKILWRVKRTRRVWNRHFVCEIHGHFTPTFSCFATRCLCWLLPYSCGRWIRNY
jgi:hypothetical protein